MSGWGERARVFSPGQQKLESSDLSFFLTLSGNCFLSLIHQGSFQMNKSLVLAAIVAAVALAACGKKEEAAAPAPIVVTPAPVVVVPAAPSADASAAAGSASDAAGSASAAGAAATAATAAADVATQAAKDAAAKK
jgi:hypothetical protein